MRMGAPRGGVGEDPAVTAWLAAANSRPDWGPVPTEEQLDDVRASPEGALAYVETMTDEPVPTELVARLIEEPFRDGVARIWNLLTGEQTTVEFVLWDERDGECERQPDGSYVIGVGWDEPHPFGDVPDPD